MLQAMKEEPPLNTKCKDKFLIQSTLITPDKASLPAHDIVRTSRFLLYINCLCFDLSGIYPKQKRARCILRS